MADSQCIPVNVGTHGDYEWLSTEHSLDDLLRLCPEIVLGRYIAITSFDSGFYFPSDEERAAGWEKPQEIAYSPRVLSVETLPHDGFDEWYVFEDRVDMGSADHGQGNFFEKTLVKGQVYPFVNFGGFCLYRPENKALIDPFWRQFDWILPQSYIADGSDYLTVVSANKELFASLVQYFSELRKDLDDKSESQTLS